MFIAHIPAGYLAVQGAKRCGLRQRGLMLAGLTGAMAPDLDLLYFYLADACRHHHHSYFTHWPVVWLGLLLISLLWLLWRRSTTAGVLVAFAVSGVLHVALDVLVGDIQLFAPWSDRYYALATVPALYRPWWLNFFLHWSMLIELTICATAAIIFLRRNLHGSLQRLAQFAMVALFCWMLILGLHLKLDFADWVAQGEAPTLWDWLQVIFRPSIWLATTQYILINCGLMAAWYTRCRKGKIMSSLLTCWSLTWIPVALACTQDATRYSDSPMSLSPVPYVTVICGFICAAEAILLLLLYCRMSKHSGKKSVGLSRQEKV